MFHKRGRRLDTLAGWRMVYPSTCGRYRLEQSRLLGYAPKWRLCRLAGLCCLTGTARWETIGHARTRRAAERLAKQQQKGTP